MKNHNKSQRSKYINSKPNKTILYMQDIYLIHFTISQELNEIKGHDSLSNAIALCFPL